jgi:hypothetical protein
MIVSQTAVKARLDQQKLSYQGYKRQLERLDLSPERKARLQNEVRLLEEEISTLEKLAQLLRLEPDQARVEGSIRERLDMLRDNSGLASPTQDDQGLVSGEVRGLRWALGEDMLSVAIDELRRSPARPIGENIDRAVASMLVQSVQEGQTADLRASAAYDLGKLHIEAGIPALVAALNDDPVVAEIALRSLLSFSDEQLKAANIDQTTIERIREARAQH